MLDLKDHDPMGTSELSELPERHFIAKGLRRPSLEHIRNGVEVFIVATVEGNGVGLLSGDASIGVMIGRLGSQRSVTHAPLNSVTVASEYALADDLRYAERRAEAAERRLAEIKAVLDESGELIDIGRIRAVIYPPPEPEEE